MKTLLVLAAFVVVCFAESGNGPLYFQPGQMKEIEKEENLPEQMEMYVKMIQAMDSSEDGGNAQRNNSCKCLANWCRCCFTLRCPVVKTSKTDCVILRFDQKTSKINFVFTARNKTRVKKTLDLNHPQPICAGKRLAKSCVVFSKVKVTKEGVGACMTFKFRFMRIPIYKRPIGCFYFKKSKKTAIDAVEKVDDATETANDEWNEIAEAIPAYLLRGIPVEPEE